MTLTLTYLVDINKIAIVGIKRISVYSNSALMNANMHRGHSCVTLKQYKS